MDATETLPPEVQATKQASEDSREGITPEQRAKLEYERTHPDGRVPRFREGMLFPLNGVWFKIVEIKEKRMTVEAVGFTKKGADR